MPFFDQTATSDAAPEDVWKLLYDPARFSQWWAGVGSVEPGAEPGADGYTMYPEGYPDFPMPQALAVNRESGTVTISCLVSDLRFAWRLRPRGTGTEISVHVEIPEQEAHRLEAQRETIRQSLIRLAISAAQPQDSETPAPPCP
jgi:uncharacterized protein YndB with AHSA1/START domain